MLQTLKYWIKAIFSPKEQYRVTKEVVMDTQIMEMNTIYYIEKKSGLNWVQISPNFETYDSCVKYYAKYKELKEALKTKHELIS